MKPGSADHQSSEAKDLVVFDILRDSKCTDCGKELLGGDFLFMEGERPLCLTCADLDHLVYLPRGNTALTRRARKHSSLSALVVRFSRARKRYERQGLLVEEGALAKAEDECAEDAPARAAARAQAATLREDEDREFVTALTEAILKQFPRCPPDEAGQIAAHTGLRSSGRVGRSAAGRALDPAAVALAVKAHIRHTHTNYDDLLMGGTDRLEIGRAHV